MRACNHATHLRSTTIYGMFPSLLLASRLRELSAEAIVLFGHYELTSVWRSALSSRDCLDGHHPSCFPARPTVGTPSSPPFVNQLAGSSGKRLSSNAPQRRLPTQNPRCGSMTPSHDTTPGHPLPLSKPPELTTPLRHHPWDSVVSVPSTTRQTDRMTTRRHRTTQASGCPYPRAAPPSRSSRPPIGPILATTGRTNGGSRPAGMTVPGVGNGVRTRPTRHADRLRPAGPAAIRQLRPIAGIPTYRLRAACIAVRSLSAGIGATNRPSGPRR